MGCSMYAVTFDARDIKSLARFWAELLDYEVTFEDDDEIALKPRDGAGPEIIFEPVSHEKAGKNRVHLDLAPGDQAAEVERAKSLGATEVDIGQKDVSWVVMADPEGNEFCILTPR